MKLLPDRYGPQLALCAVGFTLTWGFIGWLWACQPFVAGFSGIGEWDAARIRAAFPNYIVDPGTVVTRSGIDIMEWQVAELKTRLALVAGSWLAGVVALWIFYRHSRRHEAPRITNWMSPNKANP